MKTVTEYFDHHLPHVLELVNLSRKSSLEPGVLRLAWVCKECPTLLTLLNQGRPVDQRDNVFVSAIISQSYEVGDYQDLLLDYPEGECQFCHNSLFEAELLSIDPTNEHFHVAVIGYKDIGKSVVCYDRPPGA